MASEVVPPSAGKGEFARLQDKLGEIEAALERAGSHIASESHAAEALAAHAVASSLLAEATPRAAVFERRAKEPDPNKRIYGSKMIAKVLDFCAALQAAADHANELGEVLEPIRLRLAAAEAHAELIAQENAQAQVKAAKEAEAASAAERSRAEEAARLATEQAAAERAAAIARPLGGRSATVEATGREMDWLGRRPVMSGLSLTGALDLLPQSCGFCTEL